jgi:hypothetical protein
MDAANIPSAWIRWTERMDPEFLLQLRRAVNRVQIADDDRVGVMLLAARLTRKIREERRAQTV